jgi:predicted nucleic acid-binding protein
MTVFIDTSALIALFTSQDQNHLAAREIRTNILSTSETVPLVTSNYILLETVALLQHRLGMEAVRVLQNELLPFDPHFAEQGFTTLPEPN